MKTFSTTKSIFQSFFLVFWIIALITFTGTAFGQTSPQDYSANGSLVVPAGVASVTIECWGAGGGGGNSTSSNSSGGGGGGAYAQKVLTVTPGQTVSVFVGIGNKNVDGGNSYATYGGPTVALAEGGKKGKVAAGGLGGSGVNCIGDFSFNGGNGYKGRGSGTGGGGGGGGAGSGANGSNAPNSGNGGAGGASGGGTGANANGANGTGYGGGGSGNLQAANGGKGAIGHVRISWSSAVSIFSIDSLKSIPSPACLQDSNQITVYVKNNSGADVLASNHDYKIDYSWDNSTWVQNVNEVNDITNGSIKGYTFKVYPNAQGSIPLYIRIRNSTNASIIVTRTLSLTVINCHPAANSNCDSATLINTEGLYEGNTDDFPNVPSGHWLNDAVSGGTIENIGYYKFVASSTSITFTACSSCNLSGIQIYIFKTCGVLGSKVYAVKQICGSCGGLTTSTGVGYSSSYSNDGSGCYTFIVGGLTIGTTYYWGVDGYNGADCPYSIQFGSGISLPIELTSFTGQATEQGNVLEWTTASETNNDYFELESTVDGVVFNTVATVKGAGNSSVTLHYEFLDKYPKAVMYYRLRQVDFDGKLETSNLIFVKRLGTTEIVISPNPVKGTLQVETEVIEDGNFRFDFISMSGKLITIQHYLEKGYNNIRLNTSELANGLYVLRVSDMSGTVLTTQKLVKED